ncbi:MAG: hypothetical protein WKF67_12690, partial [Rubrobacteraceae bacterium]
EYVWPVMQDIYAALIWLRDNVVQPILRAVADEFIWWGKKVWEILTVYIIPFVEGVLEWLDKLVLAIGPAGEKIEAALTNPFKAAYDAIVGNSIVPDLVNDVISWFTGLPGKLATTLTNLVTEVNNKFVELGNQITETLNSLKDDLVTIGGNLIISISNGIVGRAQELYNNVKTVGKSILSTMNGALGIFSPSTEGLWIGDMFGMGLTEGMKRQVDPTKRAAEELARAMRPQGVPGTLSLWRDPDSAGSFGMGAGSTGRPGSTGNSSLEGEVRALRNEVKAQGEKTRESNRQDSENQIDEFSNLSPRMRKDLLDMAKNDKQFRQQTTRGLTSEVERKVFSGP